MRGVERAASVAGVKETCPQQTVRAAIGAAVETVCGTRGRSSCRCGALGVVKGEK